MHRALLVVLFGIAVVSVPSASGNGIDMRPVPYVCHPVCPGDRAPVWSPDGERIAFLRFVRARGTRGLFRAVFTVPAAGGRVRPVLNAARRGVQAAWIRWSPDSERIAFGAEWAPTFLIDADGGEPVRLSPPPAESNDQDAPPVWSPDGTRLGFVRSGLVDRFRPFADWCCQLWVARGDGSDPQPIGGGKAPAEWFMEPAWLGNERIAFVTGPRDERGRPDLARSEIWSANPDGTSRRRLVGDVSELGFSHLTWDAERSRLYYVAELASEGRELWWVDEAGRQGRIAVIPPETNCCAIAPATESAAYASLGEGGAMEVYAAGSAGHRRVAVATSPQLGGRRFALTTAGWAPEGRRLVFVADRECPTLLGLHAITLESRVVTRLTQRCRITGSRWSNVLRGGNRVDAIYGGAGNDRLLGLGKPDFLQGGAGRDVVDGGASDDRIHGGPGRDRLIGGAGWDTIYARDRSRDTVHCGIGIDTVLVDRRDRAAKDCESVEPG